LTKLDPNKVRKDFADAVNMDVQELEAWLKTDESRKVGWKGSNGRAKESIGHASGRRIVGLLGKDERDLAAADLEHMRKVVGFVRRHLAQRPENVFTSRWRYSLMNWGHDPAKEELE
jgi:hypothetical protein